MNHILSSRIIAALVAFENEDKRLVAVSKSEEKAHPFVYCTECCVWIRNNCFPEAKIMGYQADDNTSAELGQDEGGHDFLILPFEDEEYIIDFWPRATLGIKDFPIAINLKETDVIQKYYGNKFTWEEVKL